MALPLNEFEISDDDQIETAIHVRTIRCSETPSTARSVNSSPITPFVDLRNEVSLGHGSTVDGGVACCRRTCSNGVVDCATCLEEEWATIKESLHLHEIGVATQLLAMLRDAKGQGVTKDHLRVCLH